jgi:hypothetical protein
MMMIRITIKDKDSRIRIPTMPSDALETLREVNDHLRSALIRLCPEQSPEQSLEQSSEQLPELKGGSIRSQDLAGIRSEILRVAACVHRPQPHSESAAAFEKESLEYRTNLEKLRHLLPLVHGRLLAGKSRLEAARNHLAAAAAWARASQESL